MSHDDEADDAVLRGLARTDAQSPPPAGTTFGLAALHRAAARQQRRRALAAGVSVLLLLGITRILPRAEGTDDAPAGAGLTHEQLQREIARVLQIATPRPLAAIDRRAAAAETLRLDVARCRADHVFPPPAGDRPR